MKEDAPTEEPAQPPMFERWVAHPDLVQYVAAEDHARFAARPGWFSTDWTGDYDAVIALGHKPVFLPKSER